MEEGASACSPPERKIMEHNMAEKVSAVEAMIGAVDWMGAQHVPSISPRESDAMIKITSRIKAALKESPPKDPEARAMVEQYADALEFSAIVAVAMQIHVIETLMALINSAKEKE